MQKRGILMKITEIKIDRLSIPLKHLYKLSNEYGELMTTTPIVVSIFTDSGIVGHGECDPWPAFTGCSSESTYVVLQKHIVPALIGADPCNVNEIHRLMDSVIRNQQIAKSAIDMAVYDIWGKATNQPVHQILGGKLRSEMKVMWSIGGSSPDESAKEVLEAKERGYYGCMIKIGTDFKLDAARTIAVREAVGPDFPLIADANQGWDVDTAIRYAKAVKYCNLLFFEQPVQSWDIDGMARIKRAIDIPVSADESVSNIHEAVQLIEAKAADVFSIKVTKNGGIMPAKAICQYAEANGILLFFNSMIEEGITQAASLAVSATCSNIVTTIGHAYFSPQRLDGDICSYHKQIKRGFVEVSDAPGLGIELDQDAVKRYLVESTVVVK